MGQDIIAFCMGAKGRLSRVAAPLLGSCMSYASLEEGAESAPGQLTAGQMKTILGMLQVVMKENIRQYALFGNPVGHSLSPLMINAAFGAMGVRARYEPHCVENLELAVRMIREKPLAGVSVTLPVKGAVMAFLDEVDEDARAIGAVNTIKNEGGRLRGSNTDWTGLTAAMREHFSPEGKTIAVLGAGGAARAAVYGILQRGGDPDRLQPQPRQGRVPGEMVRVRRAAAGQAGRGGCGGAHQRDPRRDAPAYG